MSALDDLESLSAAAQPHLEALAVLMAAHGGISVWVTIWGDREIHIREHAWAALGSVPGCTTVEIVQVEQRIAQVGGVVYRAIRPIATQQEA